MLRCSRVSRYRLGALAETDGGNSGSWEEGLPIAARRSAHELALGRHHVAPVATRTRDNALQDHQRHIASVLVTCARAVFARAIADPVPASRVAGVVDLRAHMMKPVAAWQIDDWVIGPRDSEEGHLGRDRIECGDEGLVADPGLPEGVRPRQGVSRALQVEGCKSRQRRAHAVPCHRQRRRLAATDLGEFLLEAGRQGAVALEKPLADAARLTLSAATGEVIQVPTPQALHPTLEAVRAPERDQAAAAPPSHIGMRTELLVVHPAHILHARRMPACRAALPRIQFRAVAERG
mmetsp:Transcript_98771/g.285040  ORF Transcript_98771/g.285040 Transcript_98771/m.285040 type:complete len:293 (-) Transcript_98771:369-1247(-)